ncbi:MAG TPA: hypothetical protein VHN59_06525 [Chitinophagaceae bacterium]|nr:hypothetical protein [Chitinophagaceae bacterium]
MKSTLLLLFIAFGLAVSVDAQQATGRLDIKLNKNIFQPGDSLLVQVDYKNSSGQITNQSLATLELVIENEEGQRTRLRWPVIEGQASGAIFLPDSIPPGKYTLLAGLQQRFFEVIGQLKDTRKIGSIQAMLLTKTGDWAEQEVTVAPDGTFAIRNWLFEDNALLAFYETKDNKQSLNISISSQLDSSYQPLAVAGRTFYIGNPPATVRSTLDKPVESPEALFTDRGTLLPAVIVKSTAKTPAQQFNEQYVSGLFRSADERLISVMDDPIAVGSTNILNYLQGRVAGLQIAPTGIASWRGGPVMFFLDESRVSAQQIANIPMTDIAIVKAYPPPFFGAPGGGGGVAIYTRRGGEANYLPSNRQVFKIRGYTPSATALDMNKLRM